MFKLNFSFTTKYSLEECADSLKKEMAVVPENSAYSEVKAAIKLNRYSDKYLCFLDYSNNSFRMISMSNFTSAYGPTPPQINGRMEKTDIGTTINGYVDDGSKMILYGGLIFCVLFFSFLYFRTQNILALLLLAFTLILGIYNIRVNLSKKGDPAPLRHLKKVLNAEHHRAQ